VTSAASEDGRAARAVRAYSFDKHELSLIISGKHHQHTFRNDMHIQLFLSFHFYLLYLLLNSCDGSDAKHNIFIGILLVALKRAGYVVCWL